MNKLISAIFLSMISVATMAAESIETSQKLDPQQSAMTMLLGLLGVLAVIFFLAFLVKKMNVNFGVSGSGIQLITSQSIGQKEKLLVIQVGEKQLLIGATSQQISLLKELEEPLDLNSPVKAKSNFETTLQNLLLGKKNEQQKN